jgi:hypothetical protein
MTQDMKNYSPYNGNTDELTLNSVDSIYTEQRGEYGLLDLVQLGSDYSSRFLGSVTFGVEICSDQTQTTNLGT